MSHLEKRRTSFLTVEKVTIACGEAQVGQFMEESHRKVGRANSGVQPAG